MEKVLTVNPVNMPAEHRTRLQIWLYYKSNLVLTKVVGEGEEQETVSIESPDEVTAEHLEEFLESYVKTEVQTFERQKNIADFEAAYGQIDLNN